MTIAFLSAKASGVVSTINQIKDGLNLVGGTDLIDFLSESRERNEFFSRVVVSENALTSGNEGQDFLFLKDYIESYSPNLEVVLAVSRDKGSQLSDLFLSTLSAPMYTVAYLPERTSTKNIIDLIENPVLEVKAKYFSIDSSQVKAEERASKEKSKSSKKEKKRGIFGGIFGSKKKESPKPKKEELVNEFNGSNIVTTNTPVSPTPVSEESIVNTPPSPIVQESINKLFNNDTSSVEEDNTEEDFNLNFGDYGESHYQTGFIGEDEEDLSEEPNSSVVVTPSEKEDDGWQSVQEVKKPEGFVENFSSSEIRDFYKDLEPETSVEQNSGTVTPNFSEELPIKNTLNLGTLGVTLVVGEESSKFIADSLSSNKGYYVIDTNPSIGLSSYIDERSYLVSEEEFYEEGGNYFILNVNPKEVEYLIGKAGSKVIVNVSIKDLEYFKKYDNIICVFDNDISSFENQLLKFESVSSSVARNISRGRAVVLGGLTDDCSKVLDGALFSRINWKGLFK